MNNKLSVYIGGLLIFLLVIGCGSSGKKQSKEEHTPVTEITDLETEEVETQTLPPVEEPVQEGSYTENKETITCEEKPIVGHSLTEDPVETLATPKEETPSVCYEEEYPMFIWPPPKASASAIVPYKPSGSKKGKNVTLGDVNNWLVETLEESGYVEKSFFSVPGGYAIVTRLEQIEKSGCPKPGNDRWLTEASSMQKLTLKNYLRALFFSDPGLFRIVVFIVTPEPFRQSQTQVQREEAMKWLEMGANKLSSAISTQKYTDDFTITALIYEFSKEKQKVPILNTPSKITGKEHLAQAGIIKK